MGFIRSQKGSPIRKLKKPLDFYGWLVHFVHQKMEAYVWNPKFYMKKGERKHGKNERSGCC